jgi:predicted  nucleic acid-binding Zn-ribbon protein
MGSGGKEGDSSWVMEQQLELQKKQTQLQGRGAIVDAEAAIAGMQGQIDQYEIDLLDYGQQIKSYDQWLGNYENLYRMNTLAKDAEIAQFKQSGLESYESFKNAIGLNDADAAMTGRLGAGTSSAAVAGQLDRDLVTQFGADRSLEGNDGIYGMQSEVQDLQKQDLIIGLENEKASMEGNKEVAQQATARTQEAVTSAEKNKAAAEAEKNKLKEFVAGI